MLPNDESRSNLSSYAAKGASCFPITCKSSTDHDFHDDSRELISNFMALYEMKRWLYKRAEAYNNNTPYPAPLHEVVVAKHIVTCNNLSCTIRNCGTGKQFCAHWMTCDKHDCMICKPISKHVIEVILSHMRAHQLDQAQQEVLQFIRERFQEPELTLTKEIMWLYWRT